MLENKKIAFGFICVGIVAVIGALIFSVVLRISNPKNYRTDIPKTLDEAVAESIFTREDVSLSDTTIEGTVFRYAAVGDSDRFFGSECMGEGHMILGYNEKNGTVDVYALCSYTGYGFVNGILVDNAGASCIPTLLTFEKKDNGRYLFKSAQEAMDGSEFAPSVKKMFPATLANKTISASSDDEINQSMSEQCRVYAEGYLKFIGREAKISTLADEDFMLLSDFGVSADVENELYGLHPEYGLYAGNFETVEDGVRYVYSKDWKSDDSSGTGVVTLAKTEYDSGKVIEKFTYKVEGDNFTLVKPKKKGK